MEHPLHQRSTDFVDRSEMMQGRVMGYRGPGSDINELEGLRSLLHQKLLRRGENSVARHRPRDVVDEAWGHRLQVARMSPC